jgi:hypothetical protein
MHGDVTTTVPAMATEILSSSPSTPSSLALLTGTSTGLATCACLWTAITMTRRSLIQRMMTCPCMGVAVAAAMAILSRMAAAPVATANVAATLIAVPAETTTTMTTTATKRTMKTTTKTKYSRSNLQCYSPQQGCSSVIWRCCSAIMMRAEEARGGWSTARLFSVIVIAMALKTATRTLSSFRTF